MFQVRVVVGFGNHFAIEISIILNFLFFTVPLVLNILSLFEQYYFKLVTTKGWYAMSKPLSECMSQHSNGFVNWYDKIEYYVLVMRTPSKTHENKLI